MIAPRYLAPCVVCRGAMPHEVIKSVSRGRVYLSCVACGTVHNIAQSELPAGGLT